MELDAVYDDVKLPYLWLKLRLALCCCNGIGTIWKLLNLKHSSINTSRLVLCSKHKLSAVLLVLNDEHSMQIVDNINHRFVWGRQNGSNANECLLVASQHLKHLLTYQLIFFISDKIQIDFELLKTSNKAVLCTLCLSLLLASNKWNSR